MSLAKHENLQAWKQKYNIDYKNNHVKRYFRDKRQLETF